MWLKAAEIMPNGQITLPDDILQTLELSAGDHVALIHKDNRVQMIKITSGSSMMTLAEFLLYRDVRVKNSNHERIIRLFYVYLHSVTGQEGLLRNVIGRLINLDVSLLSIVTGCFNGVNDSTKPPYRDVDFYVKFNNGIRVYVYGSIPSEPLKAINSNEYVLFVLSDCINGKAESKTKNHFLV